MTVDYASASLGITGEKSLIGHLVSSESLATLVADGLKSEMIPTAELRPIYEFAIEYFTANGCKEAPSTAVLRTEFSLVLADAEIDLEVEPEAAVEYAIQVLKAQWIRNVFRTFINDSGAAFAEAGTADQALVLGECASRLVELSLAVEPRSSRIDVRVSARQALVDYEVRAASKELFRGMRLGLEMVDAHTGGIHPGELCMVAAPPKTGKTWLQAHAALQEFKAGRRSCLFTLEITVKEMLDRIACMDSMVDYTKWQHGGLSEDDIARVRDWIDRVEAMDEPFWILQPDLGQRSFDYMVREAQVREADSLLIDQLTFVEFPDPRRPRNERIGDALHRLKGHLTGSNRMMPCLLTHQINREGVKASDKLGYLEMYHLAEAAESERTSDAVYGLYQSRDDRGMGLAKFQTLAARRFDYKHWELTWQPFLGGTVTTNKEIALS